MEVKPILTYHLLYHSATKYGEDNFHFGTPTPQYMGLSLSAVLQRSQSQ